MNKVADIVWKLAQPIADSLGFEIWDVEYIKEAGQRYLRIYIDKNEGISINDCEIFSKEMDSILDEHDPVPDSYIFEVSSAGAERELRRPSDFQKFLGHAVEVKLYKSYEGQKSFAGILTGYENGVSIEFQNSTLHFSKEQVAQVRLRIV